MPYQHGLTVLVILSKNANCDKHTQQFDKNEQ